MLSPLIDIGANLTHESFARDLAEVLQRASQAGITSIIVTGADLKSSHAALELAATGHEVQEGVATPITLRSTAGVHPHHATGVSKVTMADLEQLAANPLVVAVGETGLDYFRNFSPRADQERSFKLHLELAARTGLPLFLHERDAYPVFAQILRKWRDRLSRVVVHCFTGEQAALHAYLDLDCYIGITGWICDERRGQHLHKLVGDIPDDRLLLETDAPYLVPRSMRPKPRSGRNEPCHLRYINDYVAKLRHEDPDALASRTSENARTFFALDSRV